jgi:hypothetical protein
LCCWNTGGLVLLFPKATGKAIDMFLGLFQATRTIG